MKWISVKDRLPDSFEWVLVTSEEEYVYAFARYTELDGWEFFENHKIREISGPYCGDSFGFINRSSITHWMPLPEPPNEMD